MSEIDDNPRMWKIADLIAKMQSVLDQFGNTCVYIRRGGMGWGAVALNREADDEKHGVFDLQAQHDRDMLERLGQIERLRERIKFLEQTESNELTRLRSELEQAHGLLLEIVPAHRLVLEQHAKSPDREIIDWRMDIGLIRRVSAMLSAAISSTDGART